jgi:hypothetical protein
MTPDIMDEGLKETVVIAGGDLHGSASSFETHAIPAPKFYAQTPRDVLTSKFVIAQLVFNIIASFLGPLGTFYLMFAYASEGPYRWNGGALAGVVVGSLVGSPILIFLLMPVGLPEAAEKGWFPRLRVEKGGVGGGQPTNRDVEEDAPDQQEEDQHSYDLAQCWWMFPWLLTILKWRWSTLRNLAIGMLVGVIYVPIALLIARYALGPSLGTWTLIWFNVIYEVLLAIPILLLGLLGYALEPNLETTLEQMSSHPNCGLRLLYRALVSIRMTIFPY